METSQTDDKLVGLVLLRSPAGLDPFHAALISGLEAGLAGRGLRLFMHAVPTPAAALGVYRRWFEHGTVDGVVLSDLVEDDARVALLTELHAPFVTLGEPEGRVAGAVVRTDGVHSMHLAVDSLLALGHRVIGRVSGPVRMLHTRARSAAFADAIARGGASGHTVVGDYSADSGARGTRHLLDLPEPPTAIIYDSDVMATAGLDEAGRLSVNVPRDLSIIAWDDSPRCLLTSPPLSVMHHDVRALGEMGADALISILDGAPPRDIAAPPLVFVARGSTAAAPDTAAVGAGAAVGMGDATAQTVRGRLVASAPVVEH